MPKPAKQENTYLMIITEKREGSQRVSKSMMFQFQVLSEVKNLTGKKGKLHRQNVKVILTILQEEDKVIRGYLMLRYFFNKGKKPTTPQLSTVGKLPLEWVSAESQGRTTLHEPSVNLRKYRTFLKPQYCK